MNDLSGFIPRSLPGILEDKLECVPASNGVSVVAAQDATLGMACSSSPDTKSSELGALPGVWPILICVDGDLDRVQGGTVSRLGAG